MNGSLPRPGRSPDGATVLATPALTRDDFDRVRQLLYRVTGIALSDGKESLVRSRLARRLHDLKLDSVGDYLDYVASGDTGSELSHMVDALTTNQTEFFRERAHLDLLQTEVLPALAKRRGEIRIWSAGCATGEEAYSIAIVTRIVLGESATRVRILATDISERALRIARDAAYPMHAVRSLEQETLQRWFTSETSPAGEPCFQVRRSVRSLVSLARLNLIGAWPMRQTFDVIFCRNVMIYFDQQTQQTLIGRFAASLNDGGYLCVGHSESLSGITHDLHVVRPATYRS